MELKLDGYLTEDQIILARKLSLHKIQSDSKNRLRFTMEGWVVFLVAGAVLGVISIGLLIDMKLILGILIAIFAIFMFIVGFKAMKMLEEIRKNSALTNITGYISEDEIVLETPTIQNRLSWEAFSGYGEEGDIVLLVLKNNNLTQIIARQFFSDEQTWQEFKTMVVHRLPLTYSLHQKYEMEKKEKLRVWLVGAIMVVYLIMALLSYYR